MWLWQIYHPKYGIIYDELKELERRSHGQRRKRNKSGRRNRKSSSRQCWGIGGRDVLQLSLFPV